jgi:uncharacterized membrane protein
MRNAQIVIVFQSKEVMSHNLALKNKTQDTNINGENYVFVFTLHLTVRTMMVHSKNPIVGERGGGAPIEFLLMNKRHLMGNKNEWDSRVAL